MAWKILIVIIAVPLIEVAVFIKVAGWIGLLPTIALAIVAGIAGLALWRAQGFATAARAQASLNRGEVPVAEVFDGLCLLAAGAFLLLPGLISDIIALALLLPPVRAWARGRLARAIIAAPGPMHPGGPSPGRRPPPVIEGDWREIPEDETPKDDQPRR